MRTFVAFSLFAVVMLVTPLGVAAAPRSAHACENIEAYIEGYAFPTGDVWTAYATVITGDLGGVGSSATGTLSIEKATPGGTIRFVGSHTFVTEVFGTFTTSDTIVLTPSGHFNGTYIITDGGWGMIHSHGTIDPATGSISGRYHGRICQ